MDLERLTKKEKLITVFWLVNFFALFSYFFDFCVTYTVVIYDYEYFLANELNGFFIMSVKGDWYFEIFILFLNLLLYVPFLLVGIWYIKADKKIKLNKINFYAFVNTAVLSLCVSLLHIWGGLSWIV